MNCPICGRFIPFTREEIFELNEYLREQWGTYEDGLRQLLRKRREADREVKKEIEAPD